MHFEYNIKTLPLQADCCMKSMLRRLSASYLLGQSLRQIIFCISDCFPKDRLNPFFNQGRNSMMTTLLSVVKATATFNLWLDERTILRKVYYFAYDIFVCVSDR